MARRIRAVSVCAILDSIRPHRVFQYVADDKGRAWVRDVEPGKDGPEPGPWVELELPEEPSPLQRTHPSPAKAKASRIRTSRNR